MKKKCNGCKAAHTDPSTHKVLGCNLGYSNLNGEPQDNCPKPMSWKAVNRERRDMKLKGETK